jgi:hypothetical protein
MHNYKNDPEYLKILEYVSVLIRYLCMNFILLTVKIDFSG